MIGRSTVGIMTSKDILFPGVHWILEILLIVFICLFLLVCCGVRLIRYFWKFPMPARMGNVITAGAYRNRVQPPSMIVRALDCNPGMTIIEVGCGSGFFTVEIARAVQPNGVVYAVDIQEGMLDRLRARMEREGVENIIPILADAKGKIPLDDGIADAVFSVAVIPEILDPVMALEQISRLMSKTGIYVDAELLFDPDYPLRRTIIKWAKRVGLKLVKQFGTFFSYALVFEKD